jgi:hypothetical protein
MDEKKRILNMLAEGKISVDEAERLLNALSGGESPDPESGGRKLPKFLRVLVEGETKVNVRVPIQLLRSGIKLGALLPEEARGKVDVALQGKGIDFDLGRVKPEQVDEFLAQLWDLSVDVEDGKDKVRVFCE